MTLSFGDWLPHQRWFGGRGRTIVDIGESLHRLSDDLDQVLLDVGYDDGGHETYQVIVGWDRVPADEFVGVARIGESDGRVGYDALYDERSARELLGMIMAGGQADHVRFVPEPDVEVAEETPARVIDAEQSNTSVVFDTSAILKLYRRLLPGINPDLELNRALGRHGSPHVARLMGAIEGTTADGQPLCLATLTAFARNAADGWSMAGVSARDLILADRGAHAEDAGGDFAAEAHRLGEAVASVHGLLREDLGEVVDLPPVAAMTARLRSAAQAVPELAPHLEAGTDILSRLTAPTPMQRIHGDLHLGQAMRTPQHWILIDFEGEPGQPIEDRRRPDSPMRDVAGMLRSFDYAAYQQLTDDQHDETMADRAEEWSARNRTAFCDGYAAVSGVDPREHSDLLTAYELDKAAYEAVYESRHRPSWRWIPLRSIERLLGVATSPL